MMLSGHQPEYLPYLGYIYKIARADKFILVDHIQYLQKSYQNSNRIRTATGEEGFTWLTVPVITHDRRYQKINEVKIDNSTAWGKKHWRTIYLNYKNTPFFENYQDFFEKLYLKKWTKLADLTETIIYYLAEQLDIKTPICKSSDFNFKGQKTDLLIEMCQALKADTYLSGNGARCYVEEEKFKIKGLNHVFSDFHHPAYTQKFKPFVPNLSAIDLLFNYGKASGEIIKNAYEHKLKQ